MELDDQFENTKKTFAYQKKESLSEAYYIFFNFFFGML